MKMKICILFLVSAISIALSAQTTTKGQWTATQMQGTDIIKLTWTHKNLKHNEQVSNAVLLKPALPVPVAVAPNKKITIGTSKISLTGTGNGIDLSDGKKVFKIIEGFDSTHIRGLRFSMPPGSPWFGGGERATPLQKSRERISLFNAPAYGYGEGQDQLNYSVPFVLTTGGYGLFFDNPSKGYIDFGKAKPGVLEAGFLSGKLDVYIIKGASPEEIIRKYAMLTGRQPLPPRWALGNFVSRFGYLSQQQAEEVVAKMKQEKFPMDAIIIDLFWFGKSIQFTLGNLDWDRDNWPEPEKMIAGFKKDNINTILITEPFMIEGTKEYDSSKRYLATDTSGNPFRLEEFYFGKGGIIDLFRKDARNWFWKYYQKQNKIGVGGWWGDLGEPENHPEWVMHNLADLGIKRKMKAYEVHNIYGHYWSQMVYENWKKDFPQKRLFFLNRAGFAGSQRYSIFPWTGDVGRNWSGFRAQIPSLQSMSLSGIPFAHSDAGGFAMTDKADPELYTRWLQFAAFTPVFRPHGSALEKLTPEGTISLPSEPAFWDESTRKIVRNLIRERYRLLPYNYSLSWEQTSLGKPLMRPMMFENDDDPNLIKATDQYMWGSALLVAPILQPAAASRKVYLPAGTWYNFRNNLAIAGGRWVEVRADLETIPVFAKGGSFIPVWDKEEFSSTADYDPSAPLTLTYYPGISNQTCYVYDDDGITPGNEKVATRHQLMKWSSKNNKNSLIITGTFSGTLTTKERLINLQIPSGGLKSFLAAPENPKYRILINGVKQKVDSESLTGEYLKIPLKVKGTRMEIKIEKVP